MTDYTIDLEAFAYAGRLLRTDERSDVSHPGTAAIKGRISTRRHTDFSKARVAQSLWADGGTENPNGGNWGSLERLVCDFDAHGPVWNRLNDIELSTVDAAFGTAGLTFRGCIVVTGDTWYVGDTDNGSGHRHVQFVPQDGISCSAVTVKNMTFLNKGPGLYMDSVHVASVNVLSLGTNLGDVLSLVNCADVTAYVSAYGTGSSLCVISGASTGFLNVIATCRSATFTGHVIDIASNVVGPIRIEPYLENKTSGKAAIRVAGSTIIAVANPLLFGSTGSAFDINSASNNVTVQGGVLSFTGATPFANGILPAIIANFLGADQSANYVVRSNVGGLSAGDGGAFDMGLGGPAGFTHYSPMARVKGLLVNSAGTELQGDLALQIRPYGTAGQDLIDAITASNTTTDGEMTAIILGRVSGAYVAKRVKFGGTGTGPGGTGRALYVDN